MILEHGVDSGIVDKGTLGKISNCRLCSYCIKSATIWDSEVREENTQDVLELNPALGLMRNAEFVGFFFLNNVYSIWNAAVAGVSGLEMIRSGFYQSTTVFKVCLN